MSKKIAEERIRILVGKGVKDKDSGLIKKAQRVGMRVKLPMPKDLKSKFCRKCGTPFSADTCRVRINSKQNSVVYECLKCGHKTRFPYLREKNIL